MLAARNGIHGLAAHEVPKLLPVLKRSTALLVPLIGMVIVCFFSTAVRKFAGLLAALAALMVGFLTPGVKIGWRGILKILGNAGRGMLDIAVITGLAGVVIGILQLPVSVSRLP